MMKHHRLVVCCLAQSIFLVQGANLLYSQEVEEHDVEQLTPAEVGPYRPQSEPDVERVVPLILARTNEFRKQQGKEPLKTNEKLTKTAQDFAGFMAKEDLYGHHADKHSPAERIRDHQYEYCLTAENIAYQFQSKGFETKPLAEAFFVGWKNSPPHRKNMLDPDVHEIGVGVAQSTRTGVFYGVQVFGRPKSAAIEFTLVNRTADPVGYRLGDRKFDLPGHYTRTHTVCRAAELSLVDKDEKASSEQKRFKVENGAKYTIKAQDKGIVLERETNAEPTPAK